MSWCLIIEPYGAVYELRLDLNPYREAHTLKLVGKVRLRGKSDDFYRLYAETTHQSWTGDCNKCHISFNADPFRIRYSDGIDGITPGPINDYNNIPPERIIPFGGPLILVSRNHDRLPTEVIDAFIDLHNARWGPGTSGSMACAQYLLAVAKPYFMEENNNINVNENPNLFLQRQLEATAASYQNQAICTN